MKVFLIQEEMRDGRIELKISGAGINDLKSTELQPLTKIFLIENKKAPKMLSKLC